MTDAELLQKLREAEDRLADMACALTILDES